MRKAVYIFILIILVVVGGSSVSQEDSRDTVTSAVGIAVETSVNLSEIYIGDLITYRLIITHDSDIVLTPPPIGANLGGFDVKDYESDDISRLDNGRVQNENSFVLTTFTTGDYIIPPIPIEFMRPDSTVKYLISEPIAIKVKSLIAEGADTADIREVKAPFTFKSGWPWWYYVIIGGLIVIIFGTLLYMRFFREKKEEEEFIDLRDPWEIAFEKLAQLKEKKLPSEGLLKTYYVELTEIVRDFMGRVYKRQVLDMTTTEFLELFENEDIDPDIYKIVTGFLHHADLVKFAKLIPTDERIETDFETANNIVEKVRVAELTRIVPRENADAKADEPNENTEEDVNV